MTLVLPAFCCSSPPASPAFLHPSPGASGPVNNSMPCGFQGEQPVDFESALFGGRTEGVGWSAAAPQQEPRLTGSDRISGDEAIGEGRTGGQKRKKNGRIDSEEDEDRACKRVRGLREDQEPEDRVGEPEGAEVQAAEPPRRRAPQLWSPRLRWKDERRKVLKISVNKLRRIDDPEAFLRRSVLINNTVKRLQRDMREEKGSRLAPHEPTRGATRTEDEEENGGNVSPRPSWGGFDARSDDGYPGGRKSCEEIFGVDEDFLRIDLPRPPRVRGTETPPARQDATYPAGQTARSPLRSPDDPGRRWSTDSPSPPPVSPGGGHCAMQFRASQEAAYLSDFSHAVAILDSVVYHSLLASLES